MLTDVNRLAVGFHFEFEAPSVNEDGSMSPKSVISNQNPKIFYVTYCRREHMSKSSDSIHQTSNVDTEV